MTNLRLIALLDARDRALFVRWVLDATAPARQARFWHMLTHAGGARVTILGALLPFLLGAGSLRAAAAQACVALAISHGIVHLMKRSVLRARPAVPARALQVTAPDQFSFPSGHSSAALTVAFTYSLAFPSLAAPLIGIATLTGISRVRLGVHYPGDVLAGQGIAILTVLLVRALL